jgi:hypothetical protein
VIGEDFGLWQKWQVAPNNGWSEEWKTLGRPAGSSLTDQFTVGRNFQNRLEVLAFGDDGEVWNARQVDQPPFWSAWRNLGSPPARIRTADRLTIGTNQDGRLEGFLVDQDGAVWHSRQLS